jgi:hypothetical protein
MRMNEHQQKLWQKMIDLIQSYLDGQTNDFCNVVGKLEGALDASEITDNEIIEQWYNVWTPLEIRRAVDGNNIDKQKVSADLDKMKKFLVSIMTFQKNS